MVLAGVCLHGSTSDIQKYAFIGFNSKDPLNMSNKEASLNSLLLCTASDLSDASKYIFLDPTTCVLFKLNE